MNCPQMEILDNSEYLALFQRRVNEQRVPLSGSIELTHRCNLRCIHCYLAGSDPGPSNRDELTASQWKHLLDAVTEDGCLYLLITGGEPLIRPDFSEIYTHAKQNGLIVTVFTNATLITDRIEALFVDLPPHKVEISIYGATRATYESITGVPGSYETCLAGIRRLLESGISVGLKTILMKPNVHEFQQIEQMAKDLGVKFRFDPAIFPRFDGDQSPTRLRVDPVTVAALEMADEKRAKEWGEFLLRQREAGGGTCDALFRCGAGVASFHINARGHLHPCLMVHDIGADVSDGGFGQAWTEVIPQVRSLHQSTGNPCADCADAALCGYCPAFFRLETGSEQRYSTYLCDLGAARHEKLLQRRITE